MALQLNFNQMYFFYMAARHKGIRNAAKALSVSPPAVSAQIKRLEESLGFPLLVREGGLLVLSEQGKKFFPEVEKLFLQAQVVEDSISLVTEEKEIKLYVGGHYVHIQCMMPQVTPHVQVKKKEYKVHLVADSQRSLIHQLQNNDIHVALLEHISRERGLCFEEFMQSKIVFVVCASNALGKEGAVPLQALEDVPLLLPKYDSGFAECLEEYFEKMHFQPKYTEEFTLPINRRLIPQSSYGAFFPEYYFDSEMNSEFFRKVDLAEELPLLKLYMAYALINKEDMRVKKLLETILAHKKLPASM